MSYLEMALKAAREMSEETNRTHPVRTPVATKATEATKACFVQKMPEGVRLIEWNPKPAPILLTTASVVTEVDEFIEGTLAKLGAALHPKQEQVGHREVRELMDQLEQCGVVVRLRLNNRITGSEMGSA
jgi:hypothetical protein